MRVFVSGGSGLIGEKLMTSLQASGHEVTQLVRRPVKNDFERCWDPGVSQLSASVLEGCEALIHLSGDNIASGRWNDAKKKRIRESRVHTTKLLANCISGMAEPPKSFIVASAIGYYGDRGDDIMTEESAPGKDFLADVCVEWEQAADPARDKTRVVHVRTGVVLSPDGGALKSMLLPFRLGGGGVVGSGKQYWSWITLDDSAGLFQFATENEHVVGPMNGTAPNPVTNKEFTKILGKVLFRPTILPMPEFAAKLALGEMAEALILASTRVMPEVALQNGYVFKHPTLEQGLRAVLDR